MHSAASGISAAKRNGERLTFLSSHKFPKAWEALFHLLRFPLHTGDISAAAGTLKEHSANMKKDWSLVSDSIYMEPWLLILPVCHIHITFHTVWLRYIKEDLTEERITGFIIWKTELLKCQSFPTRALHSM